MGIGMGVYRDVNKHSYVVNIQGSGVCTHRLRSAIRVICAHLVSPTVHVRCGYVDLTCFVVLGVGACVVLGGWGWGLCGLGWLNFSNSNGLELLGRWFWCVGKPPKFLLLYESKDLSVWWFLYTVKGLLGYR